MPQRRIAKLERLCIHDGAGGRITSRYFIRPGRRRGSWTWFEPEQVPEFPEEVGWFEMERTRGGWKVLQQVPKPAWER